MNRRHRIALGLMTWAVLATAALAAGWDYPSPSLEDGSLAFYEKPTETPALELVPDGEVRNIILCIGDGMGLSQLTLGRLRATGLAGKLHIECMPVTGLARTHAANSMVTDSAAAGTALATGYKADNGAIAMNPAGSELRTILEAARDQGLATGLVATSSITHATPASFGAHVPKRGMQAEIAEDLLDSRVDVLLGGGRRFFLPEKVEKSARKDKKNLIGKAKKLGYSYVETPEELKAARSDRVLGLFRLKELENTEGEPTLSEMTEKALEVLSRDKDGFFLMVEGSQIDWACHDHDEEYTLREMLHFDMAVKKALDFAQKDGHTVVVVTADHETGGLTLKGGKMDGQELKLGWASGGHTGTPVPVYAFGPHAILFTGVYDNTDIPKKMGRLLKLKNFPKILE